MEVKGHLVGVNASPHRELTQVTRPHSKYFYLLSHLMNFNEWTGEIAQMAKSLPHKH